MPRFFLSLKWHRPKKTYTHTHAVEDDFGTWNQEEASIDELGPWLEDRRRRRSSAPPDLLDADADADADAESDADNVDLQQPDLSFK